MINETTAIEIARRRAAERGWPFGDPLAVTHRRGWGGGQGRYEIETNPGMRGTKTRFTIDAETGEVLQEGHIPR
jgi:hypothetical protein